MQRHVNLIKSVKTFVNKNLVPFVLMENAIVPRGALKESTIPQEAHCSIDNDCTTFINNCLVLTLDIYLTQS